MDSELGSRPPLTKTSASRPSRAPADGAPQRNVELKATDRDPERSLALCRALGATDEGVLHQRDTYYAAPDGQRLKLREQQPGAAHLIHYDRVDEPQQRESRYRLVEVDNAPGLHTVLEAVLGVECVVAKRRRLLLWRGVRVHLDEVEGLGSFIELEAVAAPDSDLSAEHALVTMLRRTLEIGEAQLVAYGYAHLLQREQ